MKELFDKPKLIGLIGDINTGKSNLLYHIIETLREDADFSLYTYGLKFPHGKQLWSVEELEQIQDSIIILDEVFSLFELDDRKNKKHIESTLRLLHHANNVLILSILPENGKKFLASKMDAIIFKKCTIPDFINGSLLKRTATRYKGPEKGHTVLNIPIDKALIFDGQSFNMMDVKYYQEFDSKKNNRPILKRKELFKKKAV
jgi:hypothetical protein